MTTEQQELLDKTASALFVYVDNIFLIKGVFDTIGHGLGIASPYLNFRDALFHYNKMYDATKSNDYMTVLQQEACIDEHLNRGIKDFSINLCSNYFVPVIHSMMLNKARCITDDVFQSLRQIYHEFKNIVAEIRLGGQALLHFDSADVNWLPRIIDVVQEFNNLLGGKNTQLRALYINTINELSKDE
ncbi:MAG: hypothetical protein LBI28_03660 [Treponema sp.]|nr:hypothetical protein [Treponema sp.]